MHSIYLGDASCPIPVAYSQKGQSCVFSSISSSEFSRHALSISTSFNMPGTPLSCASQGQKTRPLSLKFLVYIDMRLKQIRKSNSPQSTRFPHVEFGIIAWWMSLFWGLRPISSQVHFGSGFYEEDTRISESMARCGARASSTSSLYLIDEMLESMSSPDPSPCECIHFPS